MTDKTTQDHADLMAKIDALTASVTKLETKNSELIEREKKAKADADKAKDDADQAAEDKARADNDLAALETRLNEKHQREINKITKERDDALAENKAKDEKIKADAIELTIANAFAEHKVFDQHHRALTAMFKAEASANEGLDLKDYIATFIASDDGGYYVPAPENGGGPATHQQVNVKASAHTFTKENFSSREGEWMTIAMTDPVNAKAIALEVGRNDLAATL